MSAVASPPTAERVRRPGMPRLWSVEEYQRICEAGIIGPNDRVELLEGEIIEKVGQDFPHIDGVTFLVEALRAVLGTGFLVRSQLPILAGDSVPEPDAMVLRGTARDFVGRYPRPEEVVLVAEVANTTLVTDRIQKSAIYARASFGEYWILNVVDRQLEVNRTFLQTGVYAERGIYTEAEAITLEGREIRVANLLP